MKNKVFFINILVFDLFDLFIFIFFFLYFLFFYLKLFLSNFEKKMGNKNQNVQSDFYEYNSIIK